MKFRFYFNNLNHKEKILSFLLVPLSFILIYILFDNFWITKKMQEINHKISMMKHLLKTNKVNHKIENIKIINYIEAISKKYDILISDINIKRNIALMSTVGNYENSINFLANIEQNNKLKKLQIVKQDEKIKMNLTLEVYFVKDAIVQKIENLPNPFVKHKANHIQKFILQAIIANNICINNTWYTQGDKVSNYTIKKIFPNYVELSNGKNILKLEVRQDVQ